MTPPADGWMRRQLELTRAYVAGEINSDEFGRDFIAAQSAGSEAGEFRGGGLEEFLGDVLFALANHSIEPDPDELDLLDDAQLRNVLAHHVSDWANGNYWPESS